MTCTRLSPLSVLYIEVVPTTSTSMEFKLFSLLYTLSQHKVESPLIVVCHLRETLGKVKSIIAENSNVLGRAE